MSIQDIKNRMDQKTVDMMFDCRPEWEDLAVELDKALAVLDPDYKVSQVKCKFGGLRYYIQFSDRVPVGHRFAMNDLIAEAETESFKLIKE